MTKNFSNKEIRVKGMKKISATYRYSLGEKTDSNVSKALICISILSSLNS